tara:strand:- start:957 stop:1544 length:588 start_codon:yes stop_codon:yes gene_type:complete
LSSIKRAIILGNGESRKGFDYRKEYPDAFVYGCNGAYKENPDGLVCTDSYMQHIIYSTGYCREHTCYFSEWSPMPGEVARHIGESFGNPIVENDNGDNEFAQVAGSEKYTYITWTHIEDLVVSIPEVKVSSGSRALMLACEAGYKEIYLIGFDGMGSNNVYQDDKGYERSTPRAEWVNERKLIKEKYKHIIIKEV